MATAVASMIPHHVIQRGNRRQTTFFNEGDYRSTLELMSEWCRAKQVDIWAYCLMPNPIHLIPEFCVKTVIFSMRPFSCKKYFACPLTILVTRNNNFNRET